MALNKAAVGLDSLKDEQLTIPGENQPILGLCRKKAKKIFSSSKARKKLSRLKVVVPDNRASTVLQRRAELGAKTRLVPENFKQRKFGPQCGE